MISGGCGRVYLNRVGSTYQCWYIVYHPKFRARVPCTIPIGAGILCTIPNLELGYYKLSQGMYWYILSQDWGRSLGFGPSEHCCYLLAASNCGPKFGLCNACRHEGVG